MHLFEEAEEGVEQEEMEEEPEYNYNPEKLQYPDEYNPRKPDLELQYLSNEANIMEQAQSTGIERELFVITHTLCDCKTCTDWSMPWQVECQSSSTESRSDSPNWCPAYLNSLCTSTLSPTPPLEGSQENPIELYNIASISLPVYKLEISPIMTWPANGTTALVPVQTILDTGAKSNYITAQKGIHHWC